MKILIIEQLTKLGHKKSWRVTPQESPSVFGSSRVAQIISQDPTSTPFEGVFEFNDDQWLFFDLHKERMEDSLTCSLQGEKILKFKDSELKVICIEKKISLSEIMDKSVESDENSRPAQGKKPYQLFIVRHNAKVIDTKVISLKAKFQSECIENCPKMLPIQSTQWQRQTFGLYEISQRTIYVANNKDLTAFSVANFTGDDGRKQFQFVIGASLALAALAWFSPKPTVDYNKIERPRSAQRMIFRNEVRKKHEAKAVAPAPVRQPSAIPPTQNDNRTTGVKVSHILKNIQTGRLSNLISKVSEQAARSKNLIISGGKSANTPNTGPALSALGPVDKSAHDWSSDAKGAGLTVNTQGKAGGKNTSNLGALKGGKVGSGGVGLIEDESEVVGGLDRDIIAQYIKTQLGQILYCYERQLSAQPDLFGKVAIRFEIGSAGEVVSQKIGDTTLKNATVEGCILNRVAAWKFPAPQGGTKVLVTYPFLFKSTN